MYWIITEDNMAYLLRKGSANTGENIGPNRTYIPAENQINAADAMPALKYDRFPIYLV